LKIEKKEKGKKKVVNNVQLNVSLCCLVACLEVLVQTLAVWKFSSNFESFWPGHFVIVGPVQ